MIYVVLLRHGEAYPSSVNPERPLTEKGVVETEKVAKALKRLGIQFNVVYHSPKLRAKQTAEIVARELGVNNLVETEALLPEADPEEVRKLAEEGEGKAVLCGHLPHLARLFGLLYLGIDDDKVIDLRTSGGVGLKKGHRWVLDFVIYPSLLD